MPISAEVNFSHSVALQRVEQLTATFGHTVSRERRYNDRVFGFSTVTRI
jgi:hypothetical protein